MRPYVDLIWSVLAAGVDRPDRTGKGTRSLFGQHASFRDTARSFPATTVKRLAFGQVAAELHCFLRGYEWLSEFKGAGCNIWDGNATAPAWARRHRTEDNDLWLGRIYGAQWRRWMTGPGKAIDQLRRCIDGIKADPHGRRHLVTAWRPDELDDMCLPPCHVMFQFYCRGEHLDLQFYIRSLDLMLGCPFDVASYALLLAIVAREVGRVPGDVHMAVGDCHVYHNHMEGAVEVTRRTPRPAPKLLLSEECTGVDSFEPGHAQLVDYDPHPPVKFELNV